MLQVGYSYVADAGAGPAAGGEALANAHVLVAAFQASVPPQFHEERASGIAIEPAEAGVYITHIFGKSLTVTGE